MQGFQTHTAIQPISIQPPQTQQKPRVTEAWHNAEKHYLLQVSVCPQGEAHMVDPGGACVVALRWGACMVAPGGGVCGCSGGACMVALGGVHGCSRGVWLLWGACVVKGVCMVKGGGGCVVKGGMCGEGGMHGEGGHVW